MADRSDLLNNNENGASEDTLHMESVNRVAKLPVVESTINLATDVYSKVKESNNVVNTVLTKAEDTMRQAMDMTKPLTEKLEGPMKKVDSVLCTGLDFVETNVPAIKLPPQEMYDNTKTIVCNTMEPAIKSVCAIGEQGYQKVTSALSQKCNSSSCCLHKTEPCPPKAKDL